MNVEEARKRAQGTLIEHLRLQWEVIEAGRTRAHIELEPFHMAANGYLHAGTIVTLADTCCGFGCITSLPEGAESFTTIELKSNFLATSRQGRVYCEATMAHGGRKTQVWDAVVTNEENKALALFRCTQFLLYPR